MRRAFEEFGKGISACEIRFEAISPKDVSTYDQKPDHVTPEGFESVIGLGLILKASH